jgi:hypothetical protein
MALHAADAAEGKLRAAVAGLQSQMSACTAAGAAAGTASRRRREDLDTALAQERAKLDRVSQACDALRQLGEWMQLACSVSAEGSSL